MRDAKVWEQFRDINLNHLLTFLAVAEVGSFRGAAEQLHLSQSALSVQVRQLEAALGVPLLHRTTRSVGLTAQGRIAQASLQRICGDLHRLITGLREEAALQRGMVTVAVLPSLAATLLPRVVKEFAAAYAGVEVRLRDTDSKSALAMVRRGEVDIGILSRNASLDGLMFTPLFDDEFLVVLPAAGHSLSSRVQVDLEDLRGQTLVLNPRGVDLRESLEVLFEGAGLVVRPAQEMIANSSLIALVAAGIGVTILPRTALSGLDLSQCRVAPLHPGAKREIGFIVPPERSRSPAILAFRLFTEKMVAETMSGVSQLGTKLVP